MEETCSDKECRYFKDEYDKQNGIWEFYSFCNKQNKFIPKEIICEHYLEPQLCYNCLHSYTIVYETGTIDSIDYHCKLQNNKMIFSDLNWAISHQGDFPDCPIGKWESIRK